MGDAIRVRVVRKTDEALPAYETAQSAGMDVRAIVPLFADVEIPV